MGRGGGAEALCLNCGGTKFHDREKVRIANRTKTQIKEEMVSTLGKLALFIVIFYGCFYAAAMVLAAAFGVTPTGKEPFDVPACSWDNDEGKVVLLSTLISFVLLIGPTVFVVREGAPRVYDRVWDFAATISLIHLVICCCVSGGPTNWVWWVTFLSGAATLFGVGHFVCNYYWDLQGQKRLDDKVNTLNTGQPASSS